MRMVLVLLVLSILTAACGRKGPLEAPALATGERPRAQITMPASERPIAQIK